MSNFPLALQEKRAIYRKVYHRINIVTFFSKVFELGINKLIKCDIVHGVEYAFGAHEYSTTGIFEGEPKQCEGFTFRKSILIGHTNMTPGDVRVVMEDFASKYRGISYNLITKNCNHFCNDACVRLTGSPIPSWVNRLARIGKTLDLTLIPYIGWPV